VKPLFQEAMEHVTDENWKKCIEHKKKIENEMRTCENFGIVPELITSLQGSSSDTLLYIFCLYLLFFLDLSTF
jgi:hypothetical protein